MSMEENNETLKNDIKKKILEEVKESITRDFQEQTEGIHKHMNQLEDENEDLRNKSMW